MTDSTSTTLPPNGETMTAANLPAILEKSPPAPIPTPITNHTDTPIGLAVFPGSIKQAIGILSKSSATTVAYPVDKQDNLTVAKRTAREATSILESALNTAYPASMNLENDYDTIVLAAGYIKATLEAIAILRRSQDDENSNTPEDLATAINAAIATLVNASNPPAIQPFVSSDAQAHKCRPFYTIRMWLLSLAAKCLAWETQSDYTCNLHIAILGPDKEDRTCVAGALKDTGLATTMLSCDFVNREIVQRRKGIVEYYKTPEAKFSTVTTSICNSVGRVHAKLRIPGECAFIEGDWEVSEYPLPGCNALIGADLLSKYWRLVPLGATCRDYIEPKPPTVSQSVKAQALQAKLAARQAHEPLKRDLRTAHIEAETTTAPQRENSQYNWEPK